MFLVNIRMKLGNKELGSRAGYERMHAWLEKATRD